MSNEDPAKLERFFTGEPRVRFAYLFGSRARGTPGPLSDYDIAVGLTDGTDAFDFRMRLLERLNRLLKTDRVDLVILDEAPPLLRHRVIRDGRVLKEDRPARVAFETQTIIDYLDTAYLRERHYAAARRKRRTEAGGGR